MPQLSSFDLKALHATPPIGLGSLARCGGNDDGAFLLLAGPNSRLPAQLYRIGIRPRQSHAENELAPAFRARLAHQLAASLPSIGLAGCERREVTAAWSFNFVDEETWNSLCLFGLPFFKAIKYLSLNQLRLRMSRAGGRYFRSQFRHRA